MRNCSAMSSTRARDDNNCILHTLAPTYFHFLNPNVCGESGFAAGHCRLDTWAASLPRATRDFSSAMHSPVSYLEGEGMRRYRTYGFLYFVHAFMGKIWSGLVCKLYWTISFFFRFVCFLREGNMCSRSAMRKNLAEHQVINPSLWVQSIHIRQFLFHLLPVKGMKGRRLPIDRSMNEIGKVMDVSRRSKQAKWTKIWSYIFTICNYRSCTQRSPILQSFQIIWKLPIGIQDDFIHAT